MGKGVSSRCCRLSNGRRKVNQTTETAWHGAALGPKGRASVSVAADFNIVSERDPRTQSFANASERGPVQRLADRNVYLNRYDPGPSSLTRALSIIIAAVHRRRWKLLTEPLGPSSAGEALRRNGFSFSFLQINNGPVSNE